MNIIFLGGFFPKQYIDSILENSKLEIQNSSNTFQWAFIEGLELNLEKPVRLITAPFIGWFPKYYKDIYLKTKGFSNGNESKNNIMVGFCNLPLIKNISKYFNILYHLKKMIPRDEQAFIIVYTLNIPYLKAALKVKKNNPNIKVCVIVPDLHEYPGDTNMFYKWYLRYYEKPEFYRLINKIDYFVVLTDKMVDFLKVGNKPWVRIEGLYDNPLNFLGKTKNGNNNIKIILYTGTLDFQYGIKELLEAFLMIESIDYRLWICGGGTGIDFVKSKAALDNRIKYFGILTRNEVSELQSKATLLINPRNTEGEFNKYSFPSKTMEYFASGTPALIYKLDGIPIEYFEYCYTVNDNEISTLADAMYSVCQLNNETLIKKGQLAREFIIKSKNAKSQCKKVIDMLEKSMINISQTQENNLTFKKGYK